MPLQMSTIGVCHALLQIPEQTALIAVLRIPDKWPFLHHVGKACYKV
jgi:hypothetical protein